ncbi:hypothetical protein E1281_20005 [Actinomadura sp. KC345]|uniref:carbamoyltransferase C-terminal domain-containing protein n=1 Tax=Actinomadura sp. KC345 TaxID=2530371 RepID=UPI00104EF3FF|nr:carbamoyltransferase C-terminal domain-containing protein [Actinomadura sp. KC345]TDC51698.1 hypothetical protein E1281_20005 [Actinomadura sp. KC345]
MGHRRRSCRSPFMSFAVPGTRRGRCDLPEVFHRNGLARVQTVDAVRNPLLAAILTLTAARTGIPVLINTSLNIKGKPICGTADMALDRLTGSGLDGLLLDDHWHTERTQEPGCGGRRRGSRSAWSGE